MFTIEEIGDVAVLRLQHGKVNAMDVELLDALVEAFDDLGGRAAVVITGNGRVFSAGADLRRVLDGGADYAERFIGALSRAFVAAFEFPRPLVAAIDGAAIAGGCVLACACDHRVATEDPFVIGASELSVGVPFPVAALEVIRHALGHNTDNHILRAELLSGDEAAAVGLVHERAPAAGLVERAVAVGQRLGGFPSDAYAAAKHLLRAPTLDRIEALTPSVDPSVAAAWSSPATTARIAAQLERLVAERQTGR